MKAISLVCVAALFLFACGSKADRSRDVLAKSAAPAAAQDRPQPITRSELSEFLQRQDAFLVIHRASMQTCAYRHDLYECQQTLRLHSSELGNTIDRIKVTSDSVLPGKQRMLEVLEREKERTDWTLVSDARLLSFMKQWEP